LSVTGQKCRRKERIVSKKKPLPLGWERVGYTDADTVQGKDREHLDAFIERVRHHKQNRVKIGRELVILRDGRVFGKPWFEVLVIMGICTDKNNNK
jgi:hypothetical protein